MPRRPRGRRTGRTDPRETRSGCGSLTVSNATPSWARINSRPGGVFHKRSGSDASIGEYSSVTRRLPAPEPPTVRKVSCRADTRNGNRPCSARRQQVFDADRRKPPAQPPLQFPCPEPALAHFFPMGIHPETRGARRSISRPRSAATAARAFHEHDVLVDDDQRASRPEHPADFAANLVERSRRQMFKDLDGHDPVKARRAKRQPPGRGADPIDACRLIQHRRRQVEPDDRCAPLGQAPWKTGPCRNPGQACAGRRAA